MSSGPVFMNQENTRTDIVFLPETVSAYNTRYCEGLLRGGVIFPGVIYVRRPPSAEEVRVRRALKKKGIGEGKGQGDIAVEVLVWMFEKMVLEGGDE